MYFREKKTKTAIKKTSKLLSVVLSTKKMLRSQINLTEQFVREL